MSPFPQRPGFTELTADDLVELHPGPERTVRDRGLLEFAAAKPSTGAGDFEAYPTAFAKAGALLEGVVHLHPFVDGNKRTGWLAAAVFLLLNGWLLEAEEDDAFAFVMGVAEGGVTVDRIADWLQAHARPGGPQ